MSPEVDAQVSQSDRIDAVRSFNRFYTQKIGVLQEGLLKSGYSLTEVRVMYELANGENVTASALCRSLGIDPGYLSRILKMFQARQLVERRRSTSDARQYVLLLTREGREQFGELDQRQNVDVSKLLHGLSDVQQSQLLRSMSSIRALIDGDTKHDEGSPMIVLRAHQAGDLGWIVHRHGALYAREYGWDETFEGLVAEIAADFLKNLDRSNEACWIAEVDNEIVGSVLLVRSRNEYSIAQLRLLLVEPKARGLGIGRRLVQECVRFARDRRYSKIQLWTNSVLEHARAIYEREKFVLVKEEPHHSFGKDLVGQTWELSLNA